MSVMFNRFVNVLFLDEGATIGGRQELVGSVVMKPPTIEFDVRHTSDSSPNDAVIGIYNMAPDTQNRLLKEGSRIQLDAGYWPNGGTRFTGPLFAGQIRKAITNPVNSGTDTLTIIECGDGDDAYAHTRLRKIFKGKSHKQIADAIAEAFKSNGIKIGRIDVPEFSEARPRTVDRLARQELDDICHQHDLAWSIQDGVLNVVPRDDALEDDIYILTEQSGVLDVPEFDDKGAVVRTMLIHNLRPGDKFLLKNTKFQTRVPELCKIENINFSGKNSEGQFGASIETKFIRDARVTRARERLMGAVT